VCSKYVTRLGT